MLCLQHASQNIDSELYPQLKQPCAFWPPNQGLLKHASQTTYFQIYISKDFSIKFHWFCLSLNICPEPAGILHLTTKVFLQIVTNETIFWPMSAPFNTNTDNSISVPFCRVTHGIKDV